MSMIPAFQSLPMNLVNEIISMVPWGGQIELHKKCMIDINKYRKRLNYYKNKTKKHYFPPALRAPRGSLFKTI